MSSRHERGIGRSFLLSIAGLHFMLLPMRPEEGTHLDKVYQVVSAVTSSFQVVGSDGFLLVFFGRTFQSILNGFGLGHLGKILEPDQDKSRCSAGHSAALVSFIFVPGAKMKGEGGGSIHTKKYRNDQKA